ncbi:hypothetical protein QUY26_27425 [Streptomyces flavofungini]|nr:hypothetical protein [Streptomyces flavofungini]WJV48918.1 hypothetical protein QUY26_27425 [Streptomyces flavofungini]
MDSQAAYDDVPYRAVITEHEPLWAIHPDLFHRQVAHLEILSIEVFDLIE